MGNPAGEAALACEVVAGELAHAIGLRVPDFAVVALNFPVPMRDYGDMRPGPAFLSRVLPGQTLGGPTPLKRLNRPGDIAKIVFLDSWIRNEDRFPPEGSFATSGNLDNLFFTPVRHGFEVVALDHSHCFTMGDLCDEIGSANVRDDARVHGLFDQFRPFLTEPHVQAAACAVAAVSHQHIGDILNLLPQEWAIGQDCRKTWAEVIRHRAGLVSTVLPARLLTQYRLDV